MTGLRRVIATAGWACLLLTGCGTGTKDLPPLVSEVNANDPRAGSLFSEAQAAESAGNTKKAIKLYKGAADKFPYSSMAPQARFRQAVLLESLGDDDELLEAFDAYQSVIGRYQSSALYTEALTRQAVLAHKAADGQIRNNLLGMKSRLENKKVVEMLETVRDNAPQAPSAPKAQFAVGQVLEDREKTDPAIAAFQRVVDDYPSSSYAAEAQYRIGHILLSSAEKGNQNQANLDKARHTFEDLMQAYPNSARAGDARKRLAEIGSRDIQRSFDIAKFYDDKGQTASAAFYYQEVIRKTSGGPMHEQAQRRLQEINSQTD